MDTNPVNIDEYEEIAKGKLGQGEYDFIAGAATDEITLRRTRAVFDAIMLRPRMMVDISLRDLRTTVLGQAIRFPILRDPADNIACEVHQYLDPDHSGTHPECRTPAAATRVKAPFTDWLRPGGRRGPSRGSRARCRAGSREDALRT